MDRRIIILAGCAGLALLGTASVAAPGKQARSGEAELAKMLEGRVAGKPVDCIDPSWSTSSRIIDKTAIVYGDGRTIYVNRPRGGAQQLDEDDILVSRTYGSQLCRMDMVRLVSRLSRIPGAFVSLDKFIPYTRPKGSKR